MRTTNSKLLLFVGMALILFTISGQTGDIKMDTPDKPKAKTTVGDKERAPKTMPAKPAAGEQIKWQVIASGGIMGAASANYMMDGTAGQVTAGYGYSTNYGLAGGFWMVFGPPETSCCVGRVGDANGLGSDEPTIGDISVMIDAKFITGTCAGILGCFTEADINQTGGPDPLCADITIGDISILIDYLFITGPSLGLPECL